MAKKPTCFVICPIGPTGSQTRIDADDLLALIIRPALEVAGFEVLRGDHRSEANQIDIDVIKSVQDADLCIVDISMPNPNVYYELGRRHETGKDCILLKRKDSSDMPVDIATQRYIEYDLDSRHGITDAVQQIKNFVAPIIARGFESSTSGASLGEIASTLSRVERKLDRFASGAVGTAAAPATLPKVAAGSNSNPREVFQLALRQNNIPMLESVLDQLSYGTDKWRFLDMYASTAASRGSHKAGNILIENATAFMDCSMSFRKKVEYLGCLVNYANRTDKEMELKDLVEQMCDILLQANGNQDPTDIAQVYNQRNRLYHGIFITTEDPKWLEMAIAQLEKVKSLVPNKSYVYNNLATCYRSLGNLEAAKENILKAIELDGDQPDDDHLELACKLLGATDDLRYEDVLDRLRTLNPIKAALLETK